MPAAYEATTTRKDGVVVEGDIRGIVKVAVVRYDTPTGQPVKCGTRLVRAWSKRGMTRAIKDAVDELVARDRRKHADDVTGTLLRLGVSEAEIATIRKV